MANFQMLDRKDFKNNPFTLIGDEWLLLTSGDKEKFNSMTASWGGLGHFWGKDCAVSVVRPSRYTHELMEQTDCFTICVFPPEHKSTHQVFGNKSGRDVDKVAETGVTPVFDGDYIYYEEAKLVFCCKKAYSQFLEESGFADTELISKWYPDGDFHKLFIGEIEKILIK